MEIEQISTGAEVPELLTTTQEPETTKPPEATAVTSGESKKGKKGKKAKKTEYVYALIASCTMTMLIICMCHQLFTVIHC